MPKLSANASATMSQISSGCMVWKFGLCHSTSMASANSNGSETPNRLFVGGNDAVIATAGN